VNDASPAQRRIVAGARNAARILAFGGLLAVAVVLTRLLAGGQPLQVAAVSVPIDRMWLVFTALTTAHAFTARFLATHIEDYLDALPSPERAGWVFDEVTTEGNAFVHGLVSRAVPRRRARFVHRMSRRLVLAGPSWWWGKSGLQWGGSGRLVTLALVLTAVNWWAGSRWLIALSRLDAVREQGRRRAENPLLTRHIDRLTGPLHTHMSRSELEELIGICRRLADHPLPITDAPDPPPSPGASPGRRDDPVESLTDDQRASVAWAHLVLRDSFPEADLPAEPWFVTDGERSAHRDGSSPAVFRVQRPFLVRRSWLDISE
jgi:hypothetical protein